MLRSLTIVNYALIESLSIDFLSGYSVITGETGAGKSIIIGALSLILGNRADLTVLNDDTKKCIIEGVFDSNKHLRKFFSDNDLDEDDVIILRRELLPSGKSRAFINDSPVNLKLLNDLGNMLVNIHSQHQTLQLSEAYFQLNVLDGYVGNEDLVAEYKLLYNSYNQAKLELKKLLDSKDVALRDEDYFRFQFTELNSAKLDANEIAELEERCAILENSEEIKLALSEASYILTDEQSSLIHSLSRLTKVLGSIDKYFVHSNDILKRLESMLIEANDISDEINMLNSRDDFDPEELQNISDRLNLAYSLMKKHKVNSIEDLIEVKNNFEEKLNQIENFESDIEDVQEKLKSLEKKLSDKSEMIHSYRKAGSVKLQASIALVLRELGMKDAEFYIDVKKLPDYTANGRDAVKFMFSANLGSKAGDISKIASGGELSRLMLAIKSQITQKQMLPTIIFDEIDTGVSGDIAAKVAKIMLNMSKNHQVITITHLPQIASRANNHYKVAKSVSGSKATTNILMLSHDDRVREVASLISNEHITETSLKAAKEMISEN